jgi:hypothetical protein
MFNGALVEIFDNLRIGVQIDNDTVCPGCGEQTDLLVVKIDMQPNKPEGPKAVQDTYLIWCPCGYRILIDVPLDNSIAIHDTRYAMTRHLHDDQMSMWNASLPWEEALQVPENWNYEGQEEWEDEGESEVDH